MHSAWAALLTDSKLTRSTSENFTVQKLSVTVHGYRVRHASRSPRDFVEFQLKRPRLVGTIGSEETYARWSVLQKWIQQQRQRFALPELYVKIPAKKRKRCRPDAKARAVRMQ